MVSGRRKRGSPAGPISRTAASGNPRIRSDGLNIASHSVPREIYGEWIRSHNAIVKIDHTLYLHGGISPRFASIPLVKINDMVAAELSDPAAITPDGPVMAPDGPLWYRGLAEIDGPTMAAQVDEVLAAFGVKRIVIGHTPTAGAVVSRFDGKVIVIDVGMTAVFGSHRACLVQEGDNLYAIHRGKKLALPSGGAEFVLYVKKALELEPPGSSLAAYAAHLEAATVAK